MYCLNVPPWHKPRYLHRHDGALKILFYELLWEHWLIEGDPPRYSPVMPKPAYQNTTSEAFWDIPIYAEHNEVRANRIDARLVSQERKEEKTLKYGPMMWELKQRYNGYRWLLYTPRDVVEEATRSKTTGCAWAEADVGHLKHFEHCQNI